MNREVINLGFSGNAFLDLEIASLMAQLDAGILFWILYLMHLPNRWKNE